MKVKRFWLICEGWHNTDALVSPFSRPHSVFELTNQALHGQKLMLTLLGFKFQIG